eukprot:110424-Karenia_brevis.AAC.1
MILDANINISFIALSGLGDRLSSAIASEPCGVQGEFEASAGRVRGRGEGSPAPLVRGALSASRGQALRGDGSPEVHTLMQMGEQP